MSYLGKILVVDLGTHKFQEKKIDEDTYKDYLSGYGLGARFIMDYILARRDEGIFDAIRPLGPENVLGIMSGILTGSGAPFSGRWMAVAKSPLTGMWGDSNCGGDFAPRIKQCGYDGIFFIGRSKHPVYLHIDAYSKEKKIELLSAKSLWGKCDSYETEAFLLDKHSNKEKNTKKGVITIGSGGESQSRLAGIVSNKGRLAGRCGMGAVMGSKNLKAICMGGNIQVPVHNKKHMKSIRLKLYKKFQQFNKVRLDKLISWSLNKPAFASLLRWLTTAGLMNKLKPAEMDRYEMKHWGTAGITSYAATNGDSPIKAWSGAGVADFPAERASKISKDSLSKYEVKKYGCHDCPMVCGAECVVPAVGKEHIHRVEYETLCGFGSLILQDDLDTIFIINEKLNRAGLDTISCASAVSWAIDGFNSGYFTLEDTGGNTLSWGDKNSVIHLVDEIIDNKGFGAYLRDGVVVAAQRFKSRADFIWNPEENAVHVGGQELPMHDPRQAFVGLPLGVGYLTEPTPGRHTSTMGVPGYLRKPKDDTHAVVSHTNRKARQHAMATFYNNSPNRSFDKLPETFIKEDFDRSILLEMKLSDRRLFRQIYTEGDYHYTMKSNVHRAQKDLLMDKLKEVGYFTGSDLRDQSCFMDVVNGLGLCVDAFFDVEYDLIDFVNTATGWDIENIEELLEAGRRTKTLRHSFNVIELYAGIANDNTANNIETRIDKLVKNLNLNMPAKVKKPLKYGPNRGRSPLLYDSKKLYYSAMGYNPDTAIPYKKTLEDLGLLGVSQEFKRMGLY